MMSEYEKVKKKWPVLPFAGFFIDYSIPVNPTELPLNDDSMLALSNLSKLQKMVCKRTVSTILGPTTHWIFSNV